MYFFLNAFCVTVHRQNLPRPGFPGRQEASLQPDSNPGALGQQGFFSRDTDPAAGGLYPEWEAEVPGVPSLDEMVQVSGT